MTNDPLILTALGTALFALPILGGLCERSLFPRAWFTLLLVSYATAGVVLFSVGVL
jgi:hypothetical protein